MRSMADPTALDFNPRSREGSDLFVFRALAARWDFNPRSREGSDLMAAVDGLQGGVISIHAPVKGATS